MIIEKRQAIVVSVGGVGVSISQAVKDGIEMAKHKNKEVVFNFNGKIIFVDCESDPDQICNQYFRLKNKE